MDLREKVAEALYESPTGPSNMAKLLADDANQRRVNAVMTVVSAHMDTMAAVVEQQRQEIEKLRADLSAATRFDFGNGTTVTLAPSGDGWRTSWPDPDAPGDPARFHPMTEDYTDRDAALERARENGGGK